MNGMEKRGTGTQTQRERETQSHIHIKNHHMAGRDSVHCDRGKRVRENIAKGCRVKAMEADGIRERKEEGKIVGWKSCEE